jgi:hypothetical protein
LMLVLRLAANCLSRKCFSSGMRKVTTDISILLQQIAGHDIATRQTVPTTYQACTALAGSDGCYPGDSIPSKPMPNQGAIQSDVDCSIFGQAPRHLRRDAGFLAKPQVQGSDSNFHAKHPAGTPAGWWNLDSDPNKPGHTNSTRPHLAINPRLLGSESKITCPLGIPSGASRSYWNPTPKTASHHCAFPHQFESHPPNQAHMKKYEISL